MKALLQPGSCPAVLIILLLCVPALAACVSTSGILKGEIVDLESDQPLANVSVIAEWQSETHKFMRVDTTCEYASYTLSDSDGKYFFGPWIKPDPPIPFHVLDPPSIYVHKEGYKNVAKVSGNDIYMATFNGPADERLKYLQELTHRARCYDYKAETLPFRLSIYREAEKIAHSKQHYEILGKLLWGIEEAAPDFDAYKAASVRKNILESMHKNALVCTKYKPRNPLPGHSTLPDEPHPGHPDYICEEYTRNPLTDEQTAYLRALYRPYSPRVNEYLSHGLDSKLRFGNRPVPDWLK